MHELNFAVCRSLVDTSVLSAALCLITVRRYALHGLSYRDSVCWFASASLATLIIIIIIIIIIYCYAEAAQYKIQQSVIIHRVQKKNEPIVF